MHFINNTESSIKVAKHWLFFYDSAVILLPAKQFEENIHFKNITHLK